MKKRMDGKKLNIGAYILKPYARTDTHIKRIRECGIDFIVCMDYDKDTLDLFKKHGIGAIVTGVLPGWWGGDGGNAGKMSEQNPLEKYEQAAKNFKDHPAIWGIDTGDEPSALDFPHYGKVVRLTEKLFPKQFAYLNLYPNYASVAKNNDVQTVNQLGTATYAEHIDEYCKNVGLDYICYDYYMYSASVNGAYENLRIVSEAALHSGRSMWIVLQVNSSRPEEWISLNKLRFQAFSAMAFGAENITWACYTAGWWYNQVVDENGAETQQYEKLKQVNTEISALSGIYMKYRRTDTHFIGFSDGLAGVNAESLDRLDTGTFMNVRASGGQPLIIGQMTARKGSGKALFICAADDPYDINRQTYDICFSSPCDKIKVYTKDGKKSVKERKGEYKVSISSGLGVMITAE